MSLYKNAMIAVVAGVLIPYSCYAAACATTPPADLNDDQALFINTMSNNELRMRGYSYQGIAKIHLKMRAKTLLNPLIYEEGFQQYGSNPNRIAHHHLPRLLDPLWNKAYLAWQSIHNQEPTGWTTLFLEEEPKNLDTIEKVADEIIKLAVPILSDPTSPYRKAYYVYELLRRAYELKGDNAEKQKLQEHLNELQKTQHAFALDKLKALGWTDAKISLIKDDL